MRSDGERIGVDLSALTAAPLPLGDLGPGPTPAPRVSPCPTPQRRHRWTAALRIKVGGAVGLTAVAAIAALVLSLAPHERPPGVMSHIGTSPQLVHSLTYTDLGVTNAAELDTQLTRPVIAGSVVGVQVTQVVPDAFFSVDSAGNSIGTIVLGAEGSRWVANGLAIRMVDPLRGTPAWSADIGLDDTGVAVVAGVAMTITQDAEQEQLWLDGWDSLSGEQLYHRLLPGMRLVSLGQDSSTAIAELGDSAGDCFVVALGPRDGHVAWHTDLGAGCARSGVISSMRVQGTLAAVERPHQTILDTRTGEVRFSTGQAWVSLLPGGLFAARLTDTLTGIYSADGSLKFQMPAKPVALPSWGSSAAGVVVGWVGNFPAVLAGYDSQSGQERWRVSAPGQPLGMVGSHLFILTPEGGIQAIDAASGAAVWSASLTQGTEATMRIVGTDLRRLIVQENSTTSSGRMVVLHCVDLHDGQLTWSHTFAGSPQVAADASRGLLVVATSNAVQVWNVSGRS